MNYIHLNFLADSYVKVNFNFFKIILKTDAKFLIGMNI